ncbi:MAG: hypothetical protein KA473_09110 [Anaerolineales bacterium]|nr:hypothetical protein [Anaerolineales bacterium]MBP6209588.1 hypothetical protein [Anaerolineales bacterium]
MIKNNIIMVLVLMSLFAVSSCQSIRPAVFSEQCSAPCWRNIKPGETQFQDAVDLIKRFPDLNPKDIGIGHPGNIFSDGVVFRLTNGDEIRIYAVDNIVALIDYYSPNGVAIEECIKVFGEPEFAVQYSKLSSGGLPVVPSSSQYIWFTAINPSQGTAITYETANSFDLDAGTKISIFSYFDVGSFDELYKSNVLISFDPLGEVPQDKLHVWKGYGDIRILYP